MNGAVYRPHKKLTRAIRGRPHLSAGLICFGVIVALLRIGGMDLMM